MTLSRRSTLSRQGAPSADLDKLLAMLTLGLEHAQRLLNQYTRDYQAHQAILARAHQNDAAIAAEYQQLQQHVDFVDYDQFYRQLFFELGLAVQQRLVPGIHASMPRGGGRDFTAL